MNTIVLVGLATLFLGANPVHIEVVTQQIPEITIESVKPKYPESLESKIRGKKRKKRELYPEIEDTFIDSKYVKYCDEIGEEYDISPELLTAVIEKESRGNAKAVNSYGCKGLCQVSERWHKQRMKKLGVTDLLSPRDNITVAADYIAELCETYEDAYTAMAYYGGWMQRDGRISSRGQSYLNTLFDRVAELEKKHGK